MKLLKTIKSTFNSGYVYGKAGTEVKLISESVNVLIVEDPDGNRFPVNSEDVSREETGEIKLEENVSITPARSKKSKQSPQNQTQLF